MSSETPPAEPRDFATGKPVVKINNYVRKHTQEVDVETLNQQGIRRINCLTFSKINEIIALAVQKALSKRPGGTPNERPAVEAEVQGEVRRVLREGGTALATPDSRPTPNPVAAQGAEKRLDEENRVLLERLAKLDSRVRELEAALRASDEERDRDPGLASIYREVQGLDPTDPHLSRKVGMLKVIFEENLHLQKAART